MTKLTILVKIMKIIIIIMKSLKQSKEESCNKFLNNNYKIFPIPIPKKAIQ